jgi:hypothetical protein
LRWTEVEICSRKPRGKGLTLWLFKAIPPSADDFYSIGLNEGATAEISRWHTVPKKQKVTAVKSSAFRQADPTPKTPVPSVGVGRVVNVDNPDVKTTTAVSGAIIRGADAIDEQVKARVKAADGSAKPVQPASASAVTSALPALGIEAIETPGEGNCFFAALAILFAKSSITPSTPQGVRAEVAAAMTAHGKLIEPVWDRLDSNGAPCANWETYVKHIAGDGVWAGELECIVATKRWDLTIVLVRPNAQTIVFGKGRNTIWTLLKDGHYEAIRCDDNPVFKAARKEHCKKVTGLFRININALPKDGKLVKLKGGAKSCSSASSIASTLKSGSVAKLKGACSIASTLKSAKPRTAVASSIAATLRTQQVSPSGLKRSVVPGSKGPTGLCAIALMKPRIKSSRTHTHAGASQGFASYAEVITKMHASSRIHSWVHDIKMKTSSDGKPFWECSNCNACWFSFKAYNLVWKCCRGSSGDAQPPPLATRRRIAREHCWLRRLCPLLSMYLLEDH